MKKVLLGLLAATTLAVAVPASVKPADAQVSVTVGERGRDYRRDRWRHRDRCFTERTRVRVGPGRFVVKTRRVCR